MTGQIRETYLSDLHTRTRDDTQQSITKFTNGDSDTEDIGTTIAVVTDPTGEILEVTDEYMPSLGMPEEYLNEFRSLRNDLDGTDIKRHNKAAEMTELEERYKQYIANDQDAQESIEKICSRLENDENITVVCFEKNPKWCHRHTLVTEIKEQLTGENTEKN